MAIPDSGPYLIAAILCEKVLQEKDETVSIIRMIDRVTLTVPASISPETLPPLPLNLTLFLSFKSGSAKGRNTIKLRIESPSGIKLPEQLLPILFEGEDRGANLILALNLVIDQEGVYWFDIFLEEELITRIPLRMIYQRVGQSI
ncbi:MAG: hypothetical protein WCD86_17385 [Ktedonobacteraceae bacterium]